MPVSQSMCGLDMWALQGYWPSIHISQSLITYPWLQQPTSSCSQCGTISEENLWHQPVDSVWNLAKSQLFMRKYHHDMFVRQQL